MAAAPAHSTVLVRSVVALVVGLVVGTVLWILLDPWAGVLGGWGVTAGIAAGWILVVVWRMDAVETKSHATSEDPGRRTARIIAVAASTASFVAVAAVLIQVQHAPPVEAWILAGIALVAVAASWTLIQTDYMLRIAAIYYRDPVGGIDFNQDDDPMYTDFAYISFGVGMAYQIADTNLRTNELRRIVLFQMLISYAFGAIILATVINLVAGLG